MRQISVYGYRTIDVFVPAFSPSDISGGVVWYDFSDASTLYTDSAKITPVASDGDAIGAVENKFNAGTHDAKQTTTAKKPTYKTGIQNSLSVSRYDGGDALVASSVDLTSTNAVTVFVIFTATSGADDVVCELSTNFNSNDGFILYRKSSDAVEFGHRITSIANFVSTATLTTTAAVVSATADGSLATDEATIWINGSSAGTRTLNNNTTGNYAAAQPLHIGARGDAASLQLNGDIMELILYDSALSTADRQSVESYLTAKWGIT